MQEKGPIRTVGGLRKFLDARRFSPEKIAPALRISNMTIRRMLRRPDRTPIPARYHVQFDTLLGASESPVLPPLENMIEKLEEAGSAQPDMEKIENELDSKLKDPSIGLPLRAKIKETIELLRTSQRGTAGATAIAVGALLYVLNPFDLIPDMIPGIGYLDDFAVITLALDEIRRRLKSSGLGQHQTP